MGARCFRLVELAVYFAPRVHLSGNLNLRGEGGMLSSSHGNKPGTTATFKLTTVRNPISQVGPTETVIEGIQIHQDVDVKIEKVCACW